ncbi:pilus assembly protein [Myxococcus sp. K38C18041901]|uniref:TadE family protein n=1 Tax=Myxococcus guangdongensis TaxID=2906760 RepID=UPI0020A767EC|nr:TadE family protein [Myxococcus guangdongensis]MCP3057898.1 pilus assembly protein [Myxococcus guangdongensis]
MRRRSGGVGQRGQAAVESAIVLPMTVFVFLGVLQLGLAHHARLLNEYAAYKVARSASVYRLDCKPMVRAALMALIPSLSGVGESGTPQERFTRAARRVLGENKPLAFRFQGAGPIPLVQVDYRLSDYRPNASFDLQLTPDQRPTQVHVRLAYFYEFRVPFAGWVISRVWLASQTGRAWTRGADPLMPVRRRPGEVTTARERSPDWAIARMGIDQGYFTVPLVSSWTLRMMSDPLPDVPLEGQCR